MVEVCFSDSVLGCLRAAHFADEGQRGKRFEAINLPPLLSQGDIADPLSARRNQDSPLMPGFTMFCFLPPGEIVPEEEDVAAENKEYLRRARRLAALKNWNTTLRFWVDNRPDTLCGMLYAACLVAGGKCRVMVNRPPAESEEAGGWLRFAPKAMGLFPEKDKHECGTSSFVDGQTIEAWAARWRELQTENAPLRIRNDAAPGGVASAPETWYDEEIRSAIPKGPFPVARVVQSVLVGGMAVDSVLPAWRLWKWVEEGALSVVDKGTKGFMGWTLKRA